MSQEERHVRQTLNWLIRPALVAAILLTVYGNLAQAQPSVGGWVSHGWAPALYLVLVEILVRKAVGGRWLWPVLVGFVVLALVAGVVSFTSLTHAASRWGWEPGEAWLFPIIVDLTAVLLTMASMGVGARLRELAEAVPVPAVVPDVPVSVPVPAAPVRAEPVPSERPASGRRRDLSVRILEDYPAEIPATAELARTYGVAKSTAGDNRKRALAVREAALAEPVATP